MSKRHAAMLGLFGAALLGTVLLSFLLGRFPIATGELVRILWGRLFGLETAWPEAMERIVFNIRLPRVGLACMVGMCLSAAGAAYQSVFQNPMASALEKLAELSQGSQSSGLQRMFSSHPDSQKRAERMRARAEELIRQQQQ